MPISFSGKPVKVNFANKKVQFNENESSKSVFTPIPVFDYLSPDQVDALRSNSNSNNFLFPPKKGGYYPKSRGSNLLTSWSNGPWKRIGEEVIKQESEFTTGELTDLTVGGSRIGRVTIVGEEDNSNTQQNIEKYNSHRQGKNIQNFEQFSKILRPIVRISPEKFFSYDNVFNFSYGDEYFGYGLEFKIFDENFKAIPFKDFGQLNPVDLIGKTSVLGYPIVTDLTEDFNQFVDPSSPGLNGSIDIFHVRNSILNSIFDYIPTGFKGELMGSSLEDNKQGSVEIVNIKSIKTKNQYVFFEDLQDIEFGSFSFPSSSYNRSEASGYKFTLPSIINQNLKIMTPYKDENYFSQKSNNYAILNNNNKNLFLSGSDRNKSIIGERFKSSTCGLIFGESNVLGTDSIAFGGFKK